MNSPQTLSQGQKIKNPQLCTKAGRVAHIPVKPPLHFWSYWWLINWLATASKTNNQSRAKTFQHKRQVMFMHSQWIDSATAQSNQRTWMRYAIISQSRSNLLNCLFPLPGGEARFNSGARQWIKTRFRFKQENSEWKKIFFSINMVKLKSYKKGGGREATYFPISEQSCESAETAACLNLPPEQPAPRSVAMHRLTRATAQITIRRTQHAVSQGLYLAIALCVWVGKTFTQFVCARWSAHRRTIKSVLSKAWTTLADNPPPPPPPPLRLSSLSPSYSRNESSDLLDLDWIILSNHESWGKNLVVMFCSRKTCVSSVSMINSFHTFWKCVRAKFAWLGGLGKKIAQRLKCPKEQRFEQQTMPWQYCPRLVLSHLNATIKTYIQLEYLGGKNSIFVTQFRKWSHILSRWIKDWHISSLYFL